MTVLKQKNKLKNVMLGVFASLVTLSQIGCAQLKSASVTTTSEAIADGETSTDAALGTQTDSDVTLQSQMLEVQDAENYTFDLPQNSSFQGSASSGNMGDYRIYFIGDVESFDGLEIGKGIEGEYWGYSMEISDGTVHIFDNQMQEERDAFSCDLQFKDYVAVSIAADLQGMAKIQISTNGGYVEQEVPWVGTNGTLYVNAVGQTSLKDCRLSYDCNGWDKDIWLYGDSYFSMTADDRWTSYLIKNGSSDLMLSAYSGKTSEAALQSLKNDLQYGTPEKVIWCMGMNDGDVDGEINASWLACVKEVEALCAERDIELILTTIPTCPYWNNDSKNPYIKESGYRYIDFAGAVGAYDSITWDEGMLEESELRIHPTEEGARALYYEAVTTVPELGR